MFIVAIFFTILCGALAFMGLQLHASIQNDPTRKIFQKLQAEKKEQEERIKRLDAALALFKEKDELEKKRKNERIAHLESKTTRSAEEEEEFATYQAEAEHDKAIATNSEYLGPCVLFSQRLIAEYTVVPDPKSPFPPPPHSMGLFLSKTPNTRYQHDIMKRWARARIGTLVSWYRDDAARGDLVKEYIMVRVNAPYRWIHLTVTRYPTDSREEIIVQHLKTLDSKLFIDLCPHNKLNPNSEVLMWDPDTQTLKN
jgi:hypothetical protein